MTRIAGAILLRLSLARACAWGLLVAGWVGIGSFALQFAPSVSWGFSLIALWLVALGAAAKVATRGGMRSWTRRVGTVRGCRWHRLWFVVERAWGWPGRRAAGPRRLGGIDGTGLRRGAQLCAWRILGSGSAGCRRRLGALCLAWLWATSATCPRSPIVLATFVVGTGALLVLLQSRIDEGARAPGCRAGLFDCSLPAWPAGAWRDPRQWPTLLAGWPCCR
jgi:hypothetical protein